VAPGGWREEERELERGEREREEEEDEGHVEPTWVPPFFLLFYVSPTVLLFFRIELPPRQMKTESN
jgi:hypothetical protein